MSRPATMAGLMELNSFVGKFINIWQSGRDASLQIQTSAGKAQVTLQADLGEATPPRAPPKAVVPGPARLRRSQRRADERQAAAEQADQEQGAEQAGQEVGAVQAAQEIENPAEVAVEEAVKAGNENEDVTNDSVNANVNVMKVNDDGTTGIVVTDELCSDTDYVQITEQVSEKELLEAQAVAGQVEAKPGEVVVEVRPQYCVFSSRGLSEKLKNMNLKLTCLPWVANTGRLFYTAGFKITDASYEEFRARNGGNLPNGFYSVQKSRKLN